MRLSDLESARLLPSALAADEFDLALSRRFDEAARETWEASRLLTIWDHIDDLPEAVLDELAAALHIEWYDTGADIQAKRDMVRSSDIVHLKKGTVEAVETVIRANFGDGYLMEWWEYGGKPYHFKAFTTNATAVSDNLERFVWLLSSVKRHSAKLDAVQVGLTGLQNLHMGVGEHDYTEEDHRMGDPKIRIFPAVGCQQRDVVTVRMTTKLPPEED